MRASAGEGVQTFLFLGSFSGTPPPDLSVLLLFFSKLLAFVSGDDAVFVFFRFVSLPSGVGGVASVSCRFYAFGDVSRSFSAFNLKPKHANANLTLVDETGKIVRNSGVGDAAPDQQGAVVALSLCRVNTLKLAHS